MFKRFDNVDAEAAERLADLRKSGTLSTRDLDRLEDAVENGPMDGDELRQVSKVLKEDGDLRYDDDVDVEDIVDLASESDLSDAVGFVSPKETIEINGKVVDTAVLRRGNARDGRIHLRQRHVSGAKRENSVKPTSIRPLGQTVGKQEIANVIDDVDAVDEYIYRAVKDGRAKDDGGGVTFEHKVDYNPNIDAICVRVNRIGEIQSAYPKGTNPNIDVFFGGAGEWNIEPPSGC